MNASLTSDPNSIKKYVARLIRAGEQQWHDHMRKVYAEILKVNLVPKNREFVFKGACPYCSGNLTYTCNSWVEDYFYQWMADSIESTCSSMPNIQDNNDNEWDDWMSQHSDMPYVHQLPVDEKVKRYINERYRFILT